MNTMCWPAGGQGLGRMRFCVSIPDKKYSSRRERVRRTFILMGNIRRMREHNALYERDDSTYFQSTNQYSDEVILGCCCNDIGAPEPRGLPPLPLPCAGSTGAGISSSHAIIRCVFLLLSQLLLHHNINPTPEHKLNAEPYHQC